MRCSRCGAEVPAPCALTECHAEFALCGRCATEGIVVADDLAEPGVVPPGTREKVMRWWDDWVASRRPSGAQDDPD